MKLSPEDLEAAAIALFFLFVFAGIALGVGAVVAYSGTMAAGAIGCAALALAILFWLEARG